MKPLGKCSHLFQDKRPAFPFFAVPGAISTPLLPNRPERVEPRARKRRPSLLILTVPGKLARQQELARHAARAFNVAP